MKIVHVISGLYVGGAEMMLQKLVAHQQRSGHELEVISLLPLQQPMTDRIRALGVTVCSLGVRRAFPSPADLARLATWLRRAEPDLVHSWMYHGNFAAGLAGRLAGVPVIWGLRQSNLEPRLNRRRTLWIAKTSAPLSRRLPARILCNSHAALRVHAAMGYAVDRMVVVPNSFDLEALRPDPAARASVRAELGLASDAPLIGLVARWEPQKDHRTFLRAAGLVAAKRPGVAFLLCGRGVTPENQKLARWSQEQGLNGVLHLLGHRDDVPRLTAGLDIATSSSLGEGFPSVIGEAMACGVPCVVTDVGDSAVIVGDTGRVVPPAQPAKLAEAWEELLALGPEKRAELGIMARQRIRDHYDLPAVLAQYDQVYAEVLAGRRPRRGGSHG